jgi:hypothetical protein
VSYNGGEKVYLPGLNMEMLKYFNKKEDAAILVYSLPLSKENKKIIIDKMSLPGAELRGIPKRFHICGEARSIGNL